MVYGESRSDFRKGCKYREFAICREKVKETVTYDHVEVKNCLFHDYKLRTEERLSRGTRAFNAITSVGIKKRGIGMKVCSTLFWSIIAPIVTYGCEVWVTRGDRVELLRRFQRMIGRRCQRLYPNSPNYSTYMYLPIGWMSLDRFIQGKTLMFLRTILVLDDDAICKRVFKERSLEFSRNMPKAKLNENDSPIFDILNTCIDTGLNETCMNMTHRDHYYTKDQWKTTVWEAVWRKEDEDCVTLYIQGRDIPLVLMILERPFYLIWWIISDKFPNLMKMCEKMSAIVSESSLLKANDVRLKNKSFWSKVCVRCDLSIIEDAKHVIMQCPFYENLRQDMYEEIEQLNCESITNALRNAQDSLYFLLGKQPEGVSTENMINMCLISGQYITKIYDNVIVR